MGCNPISLSHADQSLCAQVVEEATSRVAATEDIDPTKCTCYYSWCDAGSDYLSG